MRIVSFVTTFKTLLLLNDFNNYLEMAMSILYYYCPLNGHIIFCFL